MNASWRTTFFGLVAAIGGAIVGAYQLKPDLLASFPHWLQGAAFLASVIGTAGMGLSARDNNVTSEQAGAGGPSKLNLPLAFLVATIAIAGLTACQSPPQRQAFNVASAPAETADQVMKVWGDYVHQFHPSAAAELQVLHAYKKAKAAELATIDAAEAYANQVGTTNALGVSVINAFSSPEGQRALADLVALVQSFGVKL